jgi:aminoglycoside phosphotransferase (APT) family kinase protein
MGGGTTILLMSFDPGPRIGSGRSADVFSLGVDRVVRRYRDGHDAVEEAEFMKLLATEGYPVPQVFDSAGPDIVMARLDGSTMLKALSRQPWKIEEMAKLLASLQRRLNTIAPPAGLPIRFGEPESVLHLDFHPENVMLTSSGPFVIDFSNAAAGPAGADIAQSWIIMATSSIPGSLVKQSVGGLGRRQLVRSFLHATDIESARRFMRDVAIARKSDVNTTHAERARIDQLLARVFKGQS